MTAGKVEAAIALHRFGFGPVAGSIAAIADDPRGALLADLERPGAGRVAAANLPNSGQAARAFFEFRAERQARSEEHTSELQSLRHLVCRLLLEKKNNKQKQVKSNAGQ